jgi:chemotaxis protein methyltransferase CheR
VPQRKLSRAQHATTPMPKCAVCARFTWRADVMQDLPLSQPVFTLLSGLVEERVGISYSPDEKEIFDSKSSARARDAGFESMLDYYYHLRYDDPEQQEFQSLVEALLVHETFFFRELESLRVVIDTFVVPRVKQGKRVRMWCAACSTGEEPTTLAMLLHERGLLEQVELIASDLSRAALARAKRGVFGGRALRQHADHALTERYLTRRDGQLHAKPELLAAIDYRCINLKDGAAMTALGPFDVIACRNALIYFRDEGVRTIVGNLARQLQPEGVLLVGVSESLMRFGGELACEEHGGTFVYRKRATL